MIILFENTYNSMDNKCQTNIICLQKENEIEYSTKFNTSFFTKFCEYNDFNFEFNTVEKTVSIHHDSDESQRKVFYNINPKDFNTDYLAEILNCIVSYNYDKMLITGKCKGNFFTKKFNKIEELSLTEQIKLSLFLDENYLIKEIGDYLYSQYKIVNRLHGIQPDISKEDFDKNNTISFNGDENFFIKSNKIFMRENEIKNCSKVIESLVYNHLQKILCMI